MNDLQIEGLALNVERLDRLVRGDDDTIGLTSRVSDVETLQQRIEALERDRRFLLTVAIPCVVFTLLIFLWYLFTGGSILEFLGVG